MEWITHEEDLWFEFEGDQPEQLTPGRFYRGVVDGFADFGVFVELGRNVTGLLHRSELDTRLENIDWDTGDTVFVQVTAVRDDGNVDLGWSIRQSPDEFRGHRVDDPYADDETDEEQAQQSDTADIDPSDATPDVTDDDGAVNTPTAAAESDADEEASKDEDSPDTDDTAETQPDDSEPAEEEEDETDPHTEHGIDPETTTVESTDPVPVTIDELADNVSEAVRIEGVVADIRQTGGPTIFEVRDETGIVECAAFEEAGVRAYPDVEVDDAIELEGEVERRYGDIQIETSALTVLDSEAAEAVHDRLNEAAESAANAPDEPLLLDSVVGDSEGDIREAATTIRRAVFEGRPVVVRHPTDVDGTVGAVALERALLALIAEEHAIDDAPYRYLDRRPLRDPLYDVDAATDDVTDLLADEERHGDRRPLVVSVGTGGSRASLDALDLLAIYDVETVVVDAADADDPVAERAAALVSADGETTSATLATAVGALVAPEVRETIGHLPAVSQRDPSGAELAAADEAGETETTLRDRREATALTAYHNARDDKRELLADVLLEADADLAGRLAEQYRDKLDETIDSALANAFDVPSGEETVNVLDATEYASRYEFPPTELLVTELHRANDATVTLVVEEDALHLAGDRPLDRRAIAAAARDTHADGAIQAMGGSDGHIRFLQGERDAVIDAVIAAIGDDA
jgi:RecJ-like exonuclease